MRATAAPRKGTVACRPSRLFFAGNAQAFAEFIIREIQGWFEVTMHAIMNVHMEIEGMFASLQLLGSRDRSDPVYAR